MTTASLVIPADTQARFGEFIALIQQSESMDDDERQYWINVLPVMNEEQLAELKDILVTEKRDLAAIDAKYSKEIEAIGSEELIRRTEEAMKKKRQDRVSKEAAFEKEDTSHEEDILSQIAAQD